MDDFKSTLMHGKDFDGRDVAGWWMSEKLDGCRGEWRGGQFFTRQGETVPAPDWFKAGLPDMPLSGEIWAGRGGFALASNAVRFGGTHWLPGLKFCPFDVPMAGLSFERGQEIIEDALFPACPPHIRPVSWRVVTCEAEAIAAMRQIQSGGGEGVMLRRPGSVYQAKRSGNLLKLKSA